MKYIKKFNESQKNSIEIHETCDRYYIKNYSINQDGSIDVDGDVSFLYYPHLGKIPLKFGTVNGMFKVELCGLTTLENSPHTVTGNFYCNNNLLLDLTGGPKEVGAYYCHNNKLTSLQGAPTIITGTTRPYYPALNFGTNPNLYEPYGIRDTNFTFFDDHSNIGNYPIDATDCPIDSLLDLFDLVFKGLPFDKRILNFQQSLDFNYIKGKQIDQRLFDDMCKHTGIDIYDLYYWQRNNIFGKIEKYYEFV